MRKSNDLLKFYQYIPLLRALVLRDIKVKYRRSMLGYLWSLLNPLFMMCVLTVVFSTIFRFDIPNYPLYLIIGQVVFGFVSESTTMAMDSIISNASLLKKVYVPKVIFTMARVMSSFVNMLFSLVAIFIVMMVTGVHVGKAVFLLPPFLAMLFVFCLGLGLVLAALAVFFRDMFHLYGVFVTAWSFWTPIFYPMKIIPEEFLPYFTLNPLIDYLDCFRKIILWGQAPSLHEMAVCLLVSIVTLVIGCFVFKKLQNQFLLYV